MWLWKDNMRDPLGYVLHLYYINANIQFWYCIIVFQDVTLEQTGYNVRGIDQDLGSHTQTPLLCSAMKFYLFHVYTQGAFPAGLFPEFQARGRARVPQPPSAPIKWCDIPCLFGGFQGPERRDWSPGPSPLSSPASLSSLPSNMSCKENGASLFPFCHMYLIPDTVLRPQPDARDSGTISALVSGPPPSPSVLSRKS